MIKKCLHCGKSFDVSAKKHNLLKKYCNDRCNVNYNRKKIKASNIKRKERRSDQVISFNRFLRRKALEQRDIITYQH